MDEYTQPGGATVSPDDNCVRALWDRAETAPNSPSLAYRDGDRFVSVTARQFADKVRRIAAGLVALGIEPGSRICIFSKSRIEFTYLDYAIWAAGCATVTIYESSSPDQVEWIVGNSGAVAVFCGTKDLQRRYRKVDAELSECRADFVIDDGALDELEKMGERVHEADLKARWESISHDDLATLVYTSGTTGRPKGCSLTHGNLIWDVRQTLVLLDEELQPGDQTLMFLPLAHILARILQVACITAGVGIGYSTGIQNLVPEMKLYPPTFVTAVPRVFEKVFNTAQSQATGAKGKIFESATETAIQYSKQSRSGEVKFWTKTKHSLYDKLVYNKLRAAFGGSIRYAISGGAPLGERLGHFFDGAGLTVLEGYGLTETTGAATVNSPDNLRIGTVGQPIPGAAVGIADDGEVLLRGGHIFRGYWENPEATAEVLTDDGWFHTGDIGELDTDGYLRITGRKKDLIVTAGGKNVAPAPLEDRLRAHPLISQAVVVGDAEPFIAVLITLDGEELTRWAEVHEKHTSHPEELAVDLADDNDLVAEIQSAVDDANTIVSKAESIREFRILRHDFTIDGGELTPTLKVKRNVVLDTQSDALDDIYGHD